MYNEPRGIIEIRQLLQDRSNGDEFFIQTDIAAIIAEGVYGYSLNDAGEVNGFKIAGLSKETSKILKIVFSFKSLERLVLYADDPLELPEQICTLTKLSFIALSGFITVPAKLFKLDIPISDYYHNYGESFSKSKNKIKKKLDLFLSYNNFLDISDSVIEDIITGSNDSKVTMGLYQELKLFCALTNRQRDEILLIKGLFLGDTSHMKDPPTEIVDQGLPAIKQYFLEKERQGIEKLYEAKIVIVGAGESGKTTLIKKMQDPNHPVPNMVDKRTEGINVTKFTFNNSGGLNEASIQAHIWDFGGQELYHTTHQLFLTPDTLYILLNDNRKNDTDFYYWLNIVTLRAGANNPILMVFNAKGNAIRQIIPGEEIYSAFPNLIKESIDVNFADENFSSIEGMRVKIEKEFVKMKVLGKPFPAYWVKVREALSKISDDYITWSEFSRICGENKISDILQMRVLITTLHNLGVLLYFPEVFGLEDLIILNSQWCIDAIYSALDSSNIITNGGKFNEQMLAEKWADKRYVGCQLQLLKLMQHFDLCYKIEGSDNYIAPQLLPIEENRLSSVNWSIIFQFEYVFMPAGLITRLIARMSFYIKSPYLWRAGVTLEWEEGTIAEIIEHQLTHRILIKLSGVDSRRRLFDIRKCLHDLQKEFIGIKFSELIACNCKDCSLTKLSDATFFKLEDIIDDANHGDSVTCRNGNRKKIDAKSILEGVDYQDKPRVFISYSHINETFKKEFRTMLAPLEREKRWSIWDDRSLLPGDIWNRELIKHLNEANVIVLMITADFFNSDFIHDIELARAIQRHELGDALIIGILISDCLWEDTPLSKIQILPQDGIPVDRHLNRNEVWKAVANKMKEAIVFRSSKSAKLAGWTS